MTSYTGYKGFEFEDGRLQCRGLHYPIGQTILHEGPLEVCMNGLHYCRRLRDVFNYYPLQAKHRYARVSSTEPGLTKDDKTTTSNLTVIGLLNGIIEGCHFKDGLLHRLDGPAIEYDDGTKYWYQEGKVHRLNGPAIEYADGTKYWYQDGKVHRLEGPAIERADGTKRWYQYGKLHRVEGPAVEYADGTKKWFQDDKLHRLDGPAIEEADGTKKWCQQGKLYRLDGPVIEYADGTKEWHQDDGFIRRE